MAARKKAGRAGKGRSARSYAHPEASALLRPEIGMQAQFRKKKPPATYRYDSSLSPALDWDGQNLAREEAETRIAALEERIAQLSAIVDSAEDGVYRKTISTRPEQSSRQPGTTPPL